MTNRFLADRLQGFGTTIFTQMSALAVETNSVNLGQGFPDTDGPAEVAEAARQAILDGHNQYPPLPGIAPLREAVSEHRARFRGQEFDPDGEILITAGATEALAAAMLAMTGPGDEVVTFEPYYDSYAAGIALSGATRRVVTLRAPDWSFDPDELRAAFTPATKVMLLNTPHNPTGKVFSREELTLIAERETDVEYAPEQSCAVNTTSSPSPTRSTSTWCSTASTSHSPPCPAWRSAPSPCRRPARSSPSPAGRSDGHVARPTWSPQSEPRSSSSPS